MRKNTRAAPAFLFAALVLDPRASLLQFHGVASLHSFDADVKEFTGDASIAGDELGKASGKIRMVVKSIDTHINKRNEEMFKLLEPERYPEMIFSLKAGERLANMTEDGRVIEDLSPGESKCALRGELTLHGHTLPVIGKGHCKSAASGGWTVEGEAPVDMLAYGITPPHVAFITMDQVVTVRYKFVFRAKP